MDPYTRLEVNPGASEEEIRKAHRTLAARWHPDRFPEGPERIWAEQHMTEINQAFNEIRNAPSVRSVKGEEQELFSSVRLMLDNGNFSEARRLLLRMSGRSAEWNYLFGMVLLSLGETEKSLMYFRVAFHQDPDDERYRNAVRRARNEAARKKVDRKMRKAFGGLKSRLLNR